jgi:hypothetical protein
MIDWLAPSLTKKVPMIEVTTQAAPIASGDDGHRIGLEQVGGHAGAVADIVADVICDGRRVARVVLRNTGLDLADQIAADIRALGEDAAAQTGKDRDQRSAEAQRDQRVHDRAVIGGITRELGQNGEVDRHAQQRQTGDQKPGNGAGLEGDLQALAQALARRLRGAHIGADRDQHADEARSPRQHGADQEADRDRRAQQVPDQREDEHARDGDGGVLARQVSLRAFLDRVP